MNQIFEYPYNGARLTRAQVIGTFEAIGGTVTDISINAPNAASTGDYIFNVQKNGVNLFSGGSRFTINAASRRAEKNALEIETDEADVLTITLEAVGQAGLLAPVFVIFTIDDGVEVEADIAADIHAATAKTTPVNSDEIGIVDSAASNILKKISFTNLKAFLKTYFDALYQAVLVSGTNIKTINGSSVLGSGDMSISGGGSSAKIGGVYSLDGKPFDDVHPFTDYFGDADKTVALWDSFQGDYSEAVNDNGRLKFIANPVSGDAITGLMHDVPSGNCTIIAKFAVPYPSGGIGITLFQDAEANPNTSDILFFGSYNNGSQVSIIGLKFSSFTTFGSAVYSNYDYSDTSGFAYISLSRNGTTWSVSRSTDGKTWASMGTPFNESSHFTPQQFGITVDNPNSLSGNSTQNFHCEFVYYFDRDSAVLYGGQAAETENTITTEQIQCIGDSLTDVYQVAKLKSYPHQLAKLSGAASIAPDGEVLANVNSSRTRKVINRGYSGYTTQNIIDRILANTILRSDSNLTRDVVILFAGTNDIGSGDSAATIYGRLTTIVSDLQSAGFEVGICTIIDRNDLGGGFDTIRASLNTAINGNAAGAEFVIDLFADARLADASNSTYFQSDALHLKAAGLAVVAELVEAAL